MATSGRIETGRVSNHTCFYHQWQLAGQDIAGNFSRINWQAGINIQNGAWWGSNAVRITGGGLDGRGIGTGTWSNLSGNGDKQLLAGTFDIGHNGDGTKAFWYDIAGNLLGVGGNAGAWTDVPTIPRQSNPTFSKGLYTIGEEIVVNMNRKAGFTHEGSLQIPDTQTIHAFSGITDQLRWTPTEAHIEEIYRRMANTTKTTLGVDITTWNGGTQIGGVGWQNVEIQLDNANILPVFSNFTFKDANTATVAITGNDQVLIAGKSTLRAEISASDKMTAQKFATPREYTAQFDGQVQTKVYSETENIIFDFENPPKTAGNILTQITAKDSRNLGQTVSRNVQIIPYSSPALRIEAKRQNNFDDTTELKISGNFAPLTVSGIDKNRIVNLRYRTRPTSGSFGVWKTISPTQGTGSFQANTEYLNFESAQAYEIEIEVTDRLESSQAKIIVERGKPILFISSNREKVGVNKVPEFGDLDVAGDVYSRGKKLGGGTHIGQVIISTSLKTPEAVSAEYGGTWVLWGQGRTIIGVGSNGENNYTGAEQTGGWDRVVLTWGQMPSHNHGLNIRAFKSSVAGANTRQDGISTGSQHSNSEYRFNDPTAPAGNNEAHENRQKYITAYFWKRTA